MIVELKVPRWSSDRWGSRGGWGLLVVGTMAVLLAAGGLGAVLRAAATGVDAGPGGTVLAGLASIALLGWGVPAAALGWRLRRPPEVDAGDVAFVVRDPALLTEPLVIPWTDVDRVEHVREWDASISGEGLSCSFHGVTSEPRPRLPNLLVRLGDPRVVPQARSGWLGTWPLAVLPVPSPYLLPRPSRTRTTRGFFVTVPDPASVVARHAAASGS